MLSMFKEKEAGQALHWSMTRVIAFISAVTMNFALVTMARLNHVHDIAWPFCWMYVITLLAVPIMVMFKFLQVWFTTGPGQTLLKQVITRIEAAGGLSLPLPSIITPPSTTVETKVTSTPVGDPDK